MSEPSRLPSRYTTTAIALHWLMAFAVMALIGWGWYMSSLPFSPQRLKAINWHKWAGIVVLSLSVFRLLWRLSHQPPPLPSALARRMPGWQQRTAQQLHRAFYVLLILVPLLGWAYSSAAGFPVVVFGLVPLPDLLGADKVLAAQVKVLHTVGANLLAALVMLHVLAALKHQWFDKDQLLQRMWPAPSLPAAQQNREPL